jgi:uncharacterized damage-inducible protein DinB
MNRDAVEDLFAYTDFAWRQITGTIVDAGEDVLSRAVPGSGWPALRDCLAHILLAYDRWLAEKPSGLPAYGDDDFRTIAELESYRAKVRARFRAYLDGSDEDLVAVRDVEIDGRPVPYSRAELLTHLLLHERGHHGDVTTLLYQLGIEPPLLEYRFHLGRDL